MGEQEAKKITSELGEMQVLCKEKRGHAENIEDGEK